MDARPKQPLLTGRRSLAAIAVLSILSVIPLLGSVGSSRGDAAPAVLGNVLPAEERVELSFDGSATPELLVPSHSLPSTLGLRQVEMEVTAYCACPKCCGPNARGITASGKPVAYNDGRFVAADTRLLPFGTRLLVPGYHDGIPVEVIDRGGAIKGNKLDVYFPTHEQARQWGRRKVMVTILP